jgi:pyruvate/2-oxoglutarate/acetoin dehydrogenase E1 component/TPP-dependent pyruvate/acetoin dehydrogenase alpha subunit
MVPIDEGGSGHDGELIQRLYRGLKLIRLFEQVTADVYPSDKIKSPVHLAIGQEQVSVAVCDALDPADVVGGTYRSHAVYLAKGGDPRRIMAEMYGKVTGCCRGKGGSMHIVASDVGVMGSSAVVGTGIPDAAGYALAFKRQAENRVVAAFFGDGATEEGAFYETLNFAALHALPILFVCENNGYAIHEPIAKRQAPRDLCTVSGVLGVPGERIGDGDIFAIRAAAGRAVAAIRRGEGPRFLECVVYRWREHVGPNEDYDQGYRPRSEAEPWIENDQVARLGAMLEASVRQRIDDQVEGEVDAAVCFAEESPVPPPQELLAAVFAEPVGAGIPARPDMGDRPLRYVDALREAVDQEMARDPGVFVFGLDVDDHKGIQGSTLGLAQKYGADRVFTTPLSEDAMTGVAIGAAMAGMRPIHVHIRMDFMMLAMNQLVNIAAKAHYMYGGQVKVPLVVRCMIGKSWGQGAQHSQGLHAMFMHVPGLKVAAPSNAHDAKGCLIAAIRDDNPVVFMEHRLLYSTEAYVSAQPFTVEPGQAKVRRPGDDITIVGVSNMVIEAIRAAELLAEVGVSAEVIDPIWLAPLDVATILSSAVRTRRLLVVDNGWTMCGAAAEIVAAVVERAGPQAAIDTRRMGFAVCPCPTTPWLEEHFYPNPRTIAGTAWAMVRPGEQPWQPSRERAALVYQQQFRGPF